MLKISDKCIACGLCVQDCPTYAIGQEPGQHPRLVNNNCIRCGHCEAICPTDALRHTQLEDDSPLLPAQPVVDAETAALFLRSRRSIRHFLDKEVPRELTEKLLNIGRYAQTGSNRQGTTFLVLSTEKVPPLRELLATFFSRQEDPFLRAAYQRYRENMAEGRDLLLRGAPMCILALGQRGDTSLQRNATFALTYVEQYAPALGLGTCWAGYLESYLYTDAPEMRELLELPDDLGVTGALMYGYPRYTYRRAAAGRTPLQILWR